jgi:enoyl-CoA hydratase
LKHISVEKDDRITTVTLKRPPANALSQEVLQEISEVLDEVEKDNDTRVILIRGEGRFFSAGADIKEFTTVTNEKAFTELSQFGQRLFERLERFPKPIIAAIHGAALGGGLELAMACHIRLVSENAKLGLPELTLGLIPGFAGSQRLPLYVGTAKAYEMLLTSEPITGIEAHQYGLANHVYPEDSLFEKAYEIARKIAQKSPVSVSLTIDLVNFAKDDSYHEGVNKEAIYFGKAFISEDGQEGIKAFIEKRSPEFKGR